MSATRAESGPQALPRQIERLAIVNRGEAAMRCLRAVKTLREREGSRLQAIALYTEPDRDALFVRHADRSVALDSSNGAVAAYLDHDGLIAALREARADAVWPGWGFSAEDPLFVARLAAEGIAFLGPSAEAMRAVGDKITAKKLAEEAEVPVTAWSGGELRDEADALAHAERIGWPVVLKASAGGGGRGIRMVDRPEDLPEAFRSARAEAKSAFGDDRMFVEARVSGGRHIEVQIAADLHGEVRSLGCRDCSVQRRHQKVLEEAPPPDLDPAQRREIESAAVRLSRQVAYSGVGTVEFLVSESGFFFLEVNPRLQVEHGITEELCGVDLVELQIRIARGESIAALEPREHGHAIEARVCAEDPDQGFLPAPGRIERFEPALGPRVRIDSGVAAGTTVPADFDSLIAKVIATGDTREEARARLACALRDTELVLGDGATNKGYLLDVLDSEGFRKGAVDTAWLDRFGAGSRVRTEAGDARWRDGLVAGAVLAYQRSRAAARVNFYADTTRITRERVPPSVGQQIDLSIDGESYRLEVYAIGSWRYRVHLDGRAVGAAMREEGHCAARLLIDERVRRVLYDAGDLGLRIEVDGHPMRFGWQSAGQVRSGTPAMVVSMAVGVGDRVEAGQVLGVLEAMKMEIAFFAPVSGSVKEVMASKGQRVSAGEVLLAIDPASEPDEAGSSSSRLELPVQRDPLAALFHPEPGEPLHAPDLSLAERSDPDERRLLVQTLREEIRRALLGYDVNPLRGAKLVALLESNLPDALGPGFRAELAEIHRELATFADLEQLFIRAPRASVSGDLGPSNGERLRMYVRRLHAQGQGLAPEFLDLVERALGHYDVHDLTPGDALERAVLRLLASQLAPELRHSLVSAMLRLLVALVEGGYQPGHLRGLADSLQRIARMRGLVPDALADSAVDARYLLFEEPEIESDAERTSLAVKRWLVSASTEIKPTEPPTDVLLELSAAPRRVFDRVGSWIASPDESRREIALAAHVQRLYSPLVPLGQSVEQVDATRIHCVEYPRIGLVVAATASPGEVGVMATQLAEVAERLAPREGETGPRVRAMELMIPEGSGASLDELSARAEAALGESPSRARLTLTLFADDGKLQHSTIESALLHKNLHGLHPETAVRIDLQRLSAFDLERLPSEDGIYSFHGRSRDVPGDERIFVLADVRGRSPLAGREADVHLPLFERAFYQATRSLRTALRLRDPRRRLQWNRIALFVAPEILLNPETATDLARRLAPATRHLGLEKVLVRLALLDRENPSRPASAMEVVIIDSPGAQMELSWRAPHREPLRPAQDYERRVVAARTRRLVYPYEIVRMLTSGEEGVSEGDGGAPSTSIPAGRFEEFDLDPKSDRPRAKSVAGRPYGANESGIVFGLINTPTREVPEGLARVLVLSDPTRGMGALAGEECDRIAAAIDLAEERGLPVEWVPVSGGAKIAMDSGTENLDATARVVRRIVTFTRGGGVIHLIVAGVNVGAQSYFDALATMLMHTRGVLIMTPGASMVLTGRAALEASGAVSAEDEVAIGGFERIMGPNGEAQYYASSLVEAYQILYQHYAYTYVVPGETRPRRRESDDPHERSVCGYELPADDSFGFSRVGEVFDDATNPGRKRPFPMRAVMSAVVDHDGGWLERWRPMVGAETSIVWDTQIGGIPLTLVGIESHNVRREGYRPLDGPESWTGGTLFPLSSKKVARALNAASGNRPAVVLANLSGFDGSPESLRKLQLEYGAEIASAVVNFEGPILFVVVSRYHGGAYVVFSQELNEGLEASALEGSFASVIGGGPAAAVVFSREVRALAVADPRVAEAEARLRARPTPEAREALDRALREVSLEKQAELAGEFDRVHSVERAREVGSLDHIVRADDLRAFVIRSLERALA